MAYAYCHSCGFVFPSAIARMFGGGNLSMSQCVEQCPRCGGAAETQNATVSGGTVRPSGGNSVPATIAFEVFQRHAVATLANVRINRQQARRFNRAVEKKGETAVKRVAHEIAPEVGAAVDEALKSDRPNEALSWLNKLITFGAKVGVGLFATFAGINEGIDLIERLNGAKPIDQIIRELQDDQQNEERQTEPQTKKDKGQKSQFNKEPPEWV